ncbi:MAG: cache domain-containing protein [Pseudomonadota bacterium]
MARWDKNRGVLIHEHTKFWKHNIHDVGEPNLQQDIFPYDTVSRIDFDFRLLPPAPASEFLISDSTFRDGQQARPPYTVEQIVHIFDLLHRLGGPNGVIRQSEFFLYSKKDKEAVAKCLEKGYPCPKVTGWIRANKADLALVKEMELKETGILTSVSDYHIFLKLNMTRKKALDSYLGIVKKALDMGIIPRCHFEDITRADIYGFCVPFALELMRLREESGINVKIRMCDTLGFGITYPGAALPRSVPKLVRALIDDACVPGHLLEWHGHNDFHKGFINATTTWLYGCSTINGTLLGFGERTGNTPIEAVIIEHIALTGNMNGIDTRIITDIADYFQDELEYRIPPNYPFIGSDFNATSAGIHADGLIKNEQIYNIFDTKKLFNRPVQVIITDKSGTAGIAHWISNKLKLSAGEEIDKRHPGIVKIHKEIMEQYETGRNTSISNEEMMQWAQKYLPDYFMSEFDILKEEADELAAHLVSDLIQLPAIRSMNRKKQEQALQECLEKNPFIQFIYITDASGRRITQNITHVSDKAKYKSAVIGEDMSDRPWFSPPLEQGDVFVTDFYTSRYTGKLCITVSGPIRNKSDEIIGILGADIKFEDLAKMQTDGEIEK